MPASCTTSMQLGQLLPELAEGRHGALQICDLTADSRKVVLGGLFCACSGLRSHGLDHLPAALDRGAAVVLAEPDDHWHLARIAQLGAASEVPIIPSDRLGWRLGELASDFLGKPSQRLSVCGITGTNGKTSCAWFIAALDQQPTALIGTLGNGFPRHMQKASHTTPDAVQLQHLLNDFLQQGAAAVAMEVSSHALDQRRVSGVRFEDAVFTNLSQDHLDYHQTMERYATAKASLFATEGLQRAIINADDAAALRMLKPLARGCEPILYGLREPKLPGRAARRLWATNLRADADGTRLSLRGDWGRHELHLPLPGRFNVLNLLAAMAVLLGRGQSPEPLIERVQGLTGVPGRMQQIGRGPRVVVDFAHTPDALEQALLTLREHVPGRLTCVFGCGGDRDTGKRSEMGRIAARLADRVWITSDNPRHEEPMAIIDQIREGAPQARIEPDRRRAIRAAVAEADTGDVILLAGKGHEQTQQLGDLCIPFDDLDEARKALDLRGTSQ